MNAMTMIKRLSTLTALALALLTLTVASAGANCLTPVSQVRSVSCSAFVHDYYLGEQDSDSAGDAAMDFSLYDSAQSVIATLDIGYANGGDWQVSTIGGSRITARGGQSAFVDIFDSEAYAEASASSIFDVTFEVSETLDAHLFGSVVFQSEIPSGSSMVVLTGPGGIVFSEFAESYYGEVNFDETVALGPGMWRLEARATGSAYTDYAPSSYSSGEFDVTLGVCPVDAALTCVPGLGTLPFVSNFTVSIDNYETSRPASLMAARINVTIADGSTFTNWKAGSTVISSGSAYTTGWNQDIPLLGTLVGDNVFTLVVEDVSPAPYNQPPYSPSGFVTTDSCTVAGTAE